MKYQSLTKIPNTNLIKHFLMNLIPLTHYNELWMPAYFGSRMPILSILGFKTLVKRILELIVMAPRKIYQTNSTLSSQNSAQVLILG